MIYMETPCDRLEFPKAEGVKAEKIQVIGEDFAFTVKSDLKGTQITPSVREDPEEDPELIKRVRLRELGCDLEFRIFSLNNGNAFELNPEAVARIGNLAAYVHRGAWHLAALHMIGCKCTRCARLQKIFREIVPESIRKVFWASSMLNSDDVRENGHVLDRLCFASECTENRREKAGEIIRGAKCFYTSIYGNLPIPTRKVELDKTSKKLVPKPGRAVFLAPDMYKNPGKIVAFTRRGKLGELPKALTRELAPMIERGVQYTGKIARIMGSWRNEEDRIALEISRSS
jgi:hypothetical protein